MKHGIWLMMISVHHLVIGGLSHHCLHMIWLKIYLVIQQQFMMISVASYDCNICGNPWRYLWQSVMLSVHHRFVSLCVSVTWKLCHTLFQRSSNISYARSVCSAWQTNQQSSPVCAEGGGWYVRDGDKQGKYCSRTCTQLTEMEGERGKLGISLGLEVARFWWNIQSLVKYGSGTGVFNIEWVLDHWPICYLIHDQCRR